MYSLTGSPWGSFSQMVSGGHFHYRFIRGTALPWQTSWEMISGGQFHFRSIYGRAFPRPLCGKLSPELTFNINLFVDGCILGHLLGNGFRRHFQYKSIRGQALLGALLGNGVRRSLAVEIILLHGITGPQVYITRNPWVRASIRTRLHESRSRLVLRVFVASPSVHRSMGAREFSFFFGGGYLFFGFRGPETLTEKWRTRAER